MKKVLAVVLALVLVLSLTACGGGESLEGSWKLTGYTEDGKDAMDESSGITIAKLESKGIYFGLVAKSDKTATLSIMGDEDKMTWDSKTIKSSDGKTSASYEIKDGVLTISGESEEGKKQVMTFKKMTEDEKKKFEALTPEDISNVIIEFAMEALAAQMGGEE